MPRPTKSRSWSFSLPHALDARLLLALPALTYALSYIYLAVYHRRLNLWNVIVHEGGLFTLLETTLYASHFLGHVPVHTLVALLFVGAYRTLTPDANAMKPRPRIAGYAILCLLGASLVFSLVHFGAEDTWAYILQRKQTVRLYVRGGSWNLHLASTCLLFAWAPLYVLVFSLACGKRTVCSCAGRGYFLAAALFLPAFTLLANGGELIGPFAVAWSNPRYLAHSVRELATFSLVYFPIPLYLLVRGDPSLEPRMIWPRSRTLRIAAGVLGADCMAALAWQCVAALSAGVGTLAQKPAFAKGGQLSILYLLSSHFFEHVLDTIYFVLLVCGLFQFKINRRERIHHDCR